MPGTICSIATCKSSQAKAKRDGEAMRFFTFPKNHIVRKQWVKLCYRDDTFNPNNKKICSKHFASCQFEDEIQSKLINAQPKRLKKTAIPMLLLPNKTNKTPSERRIKIEIKERKQIVSNLLKTEENTIDIVTETLSPPVFEIKNFPSTSNTTPYEILFKKYRDLEEENECLKNQISNDKQTIGTLLEKIKNLEHEIDKNRKV